MYVYCVRPHVSFLWLHIRWKHEFSVSRTRFINFHYCCYCYTGVSLSLHFFLFLSLVRSLCHRAYVSFRSIFIHIALLTLFYKYAKILSWATTIQWLNYFAILWVLLVSLPSLHHHHHPSLLPIMCVYVSVASRQNSLYGISCVWESLWICFASDGNDLELENETVLNNSRFSTTL